MYRKGVSALIMNDKEEFLLVNLHSFMEHFYAIPGGGVDGEETLEQAVYREIFEELGIRKELLSIVGYSDTPVQITFKEIKLSRDGIEYIGSERYFFGFKFLGTDKDIYIIDNEVRKYTWSSVNNLNKYLLFDGECDETIEKIQEIFSFLR